jgi:hypothetical protein
MAIRYIPPAKNHSFWKWYEKLKINPESYEHHVTSWSNPIYVRIRYFTSTSFFLFQGTLNIFSKQFSYCMASVEFLLLYLGVFVGIAVDICWFCEVSEQPTYWTEQRPNVSTLYPEFWFQNIFIFVQEVMLYLDFFWFQKVNLSVKYVSFLLKSQCFNKTIKYSMKTRCCVEVHSSFCYCIVI